MGHREIVRRKVEVQEDRISSLPDDLIHRILSLTGPQFAVQTSLQLSTRWKNLWKSLPHLDFDIENFNGNISNFVSQLLRHRDHQSSLNLFNLNCTELMDHRSLVHKIADYGALHNLQHLSIYTSVLELPPSVFTCQSLNRLSITSHGSQVPKSPWNLPALTTLFLEGVSFRSFWDKDFSKSVDFFSNLSNLKNLTLSECDGYGLKVFNITCPRLENLYITFREDAASPWICRCKFVISAPKLSCFKYEGDKALVMSVNNLNCLDKLYINIHGYYRERKYEFKQRVCQEIISMFRQLRDAKFVTLTFQTIEVLSWVFELLENHQSPFHKMECLKIEGGYWWKKKSTISTSHVLTYLCNSSPSPPTVINECSRLFQDP